jgi:hypothetical protein
MGIGSTDVVNNVSVVRREEHSFDCYKIQCKIIIQSSKSRCQRNTNMLEQQQGCGESRNVSLKGVFFRDFFYKVSILDECDS